MSTVYTDMYIHRISICVLLSETRLLIFRVWFWFVVREAALHAFMGWICVDGTSNIVYMGCTLRGEETNIFERYVCARSKLVHVSVCVCV